MAIGHPAFTKTTRHGMALLAVLLLSACTTTSGSNRLDETGEQIAETTAGDEPETSAFYIQALNGGLISRVPGLKLSSGDKARALEAEYKVLEAAPGGQPVAWEGSGVRGDVVAAAPYQVGSQNCRQYSHSVTVKSAAVPVVARGAACRNKNGSWTPL